MFGPLSIANSAAAIFLEALYVRICTTFLAHLFDISINTTEYVLRLVNLFIIFLRRKEVTGFSRTSHDAPFSNYSCIGHHTQIYSHTSSCFLGNSILTLCFNDGSRIDTAWLFIRPAKKTGAINVSKSSLL